MRPLSLFVAGLASSSTIAVSDGCRSTIAVSAGSSSRPGGIAGIGAAGRRPSLESAILPATSLSLAILQGVL